MNILICSASAKIQLIEFFQAAVRPEGGKIVAADMEAHCCARYFADAFVQLPADRDPAYGETLLRVCREHAIRLIIPTRDGELKLLAAMKPELEAMGVTVPLPAGESLDICLDKARFHDFCVTHGYPVLPFVDPSSPGNFPVFVRKRISSGSRGAYAVHSVDAFNGLALRLEDHIVQPYCEAAEYSCDILMDFEGRALQAVVRERQRLVNGESWRSQIVDIPDLSAIAINLAEKLGLRGHNLVQMFWNETQGGHVIEVNPRFGGGSSLSIRGGLDSAERMVQMVLGRHEAARTPRPLRAGLTAIRYARDIFLGDLDANGSGSN
ncbi:MAG: ATP-grasp domain-containing protein [Alphaproteobacteria bacterium]|nr:MAG: ATP-grasp domain-containing protein [Alphaproteobacteria bacterium]